MPQADHLPLNVQPRAAPQVTVEVDWKAGGTMILMQQGYDAINRERL